MMSETGSPFSSLIQTRKWAGPLIHVLLAVGALAFIFPMLWMLSTSLKSMEAVMASPPRWLPDHARWANYHDMLQVVSMVRYFYNTLFVAVVGAIGMTASSAIVAYSFARMQWPGRDFLFAVMIATMMVPFPVVMVPLYALFRDLGWIGSLKPLWIPAFFGAAFNIFLLRQFFLRVPKSLGEAMSLEGASEWTIFTRIYLPLARPALAVVALLHITYCWNDFIGPLLYLTEPETFTLSLGLQQFQSQNGGTFWQLLMAAAVVTVLPMVLLYLVAQKTFMRMSTMKNVDLQ